MSDNLGKRFAAAGLPYEITGCRLDSLFNGGTFVFASYQHGDTYRQFAGYHGIVEAAPVAREARKIKGCYAAYVVTANEKE